MTVGTRQRRGPRGHRMGEFHQKSVRSDEEVVMMREMHAAGLGYLLLGRWWECGESTARDICKFRTRADV